MQPKQIELSLISKLPKRPKLTNAQRPPNSETISTNYYSLSKLESRIVYQYEITFDPPLPQDSRAILKGCVASVASQLQKKLIFFILRGKTIYAFANLVGINSFECNYTHKSQTEGEEIVFTNLLNLLKTKELDIGNIYSDKKSGMKILQLLNSNLKQQFEQSGLIELQRGKFYNKNEIKVQDSPFVIYRGFYTSIHLINQQPKLLIDVSTRVIRKQTLYNTLVFCKMDDKDELIGRNVIVKYGNWKIYNIKKIETKVKATSTFLKDGKAITYADYFKQAYGINLVHKDQKMILSSAKKQVNVSGKLVEQEIDIYLAPELCYLTGLHDNERSNFNLMKSISQHTKMKPQDRVTQTKSLVNNIKGLSKMFQISDQQDKPKGHVLNQPTFIYGNNIKVNASNGLINSRNKLFSPMNLKNWLIVSTVTSQSDQNNRQMFISNLNKAAMAYGITLSRPAILETDIWNQKEFMQDIEWELNENKPDFVVTLLKNQEAKFYAYLKVLFLNKFGILHQAVLVKTITNEKRSYSVCSNILLQMNAKLGFPLWKIEKNFPYLKNKKIIIGGMAIYHKLAGANSSCCAFVGTTNDSQTEYYQDAKLIPQNQQRFDYLYSMTEQWVKKYCTANKSVPDMIVFFRDGVGETQIQNILNLEVEVIKKTIQTIKTKMKKPDYNPGVLFILANKDINQRLYRNVAGKVSNPISGTVVGEGLSRYGFDFHMSPHYVNEGTCTPTQFNVIYNTTNLAEDEIWQLTFSSCFEYYNWNGAIRIPAPLQYANKLATLVGDSMKQEPNSKELKYKLYCL